MLCVWDSSSCLMLLGSGFCRSSHTYYCTSSWSYRWHEATGQVTRPTLVPCLSAFDSRTRERLKRGGTGMPQRSFGCCPFLPLLPLLLLRTKRGFMYPPLLSPSPSLSIIILLSPSPSLLSLLPSSSSSAVTTTKTTTVSSHFSLVANSRLQRPRGDCTALIAGPGTQHTYRIEAID